MTKHPFILNLSSRSTRFRSARFRAVSRASAIALTLSVIGVGAVPAAAQEPVTGGDQFISEYADAVFTRKGVTFHVAPGRIDDSGTVSEVLEARISEQFCASKYLVETDATASESAPDLAGVELNALAGSATVSGEYTFTGAVTVTPAGRNCATPNYALSVTTPLTAQVTLAATWKNARNSVPVIYSGADCGGDGICYYRDAAATGAFESDFLGSFAKKRGPGFLFQGTYSAASAAAAQVASV